ETVRLAGILPDGEPAETSHAGRSNWPNGDRYTVNMISRDGSRVFFTDGSGNIYVRLNHTSTVQLAAGELWTVTPDGSKVFFAAGQPLTPDAGSEVGTNKLYMYDFDAPAGHRLTFISKDTEPIDGSYGAVEEVWGASADGSYVYFTTFRNRL